MLRSKNSQFLQENKKVNYGAVIRFENYRRGTKIIV